MIDKYESFVDQQLVLCMNIYYSAFMEQKITHGLLLTMTFIKVYQNWCICGSWTFNVS